MFGITIPLAIIIILAGVPLILTTKVLGVTMLGQYLFKKFKWNNSKRFVYFLFGLIFYAVLNFIPVIAFISMIFFSTSFSLTCIVILFGGVLGIMLSPPHLQNILRHLPIPALNTMPSGHR